MELRLGEFGDERLAKGGRFCTRGLSAMAAGGQRQAARRRPGRRDADHAVSAQSQGDDQRNDVHGAGRTCARVAGRHVLAIQDTSALRVDEKGLGLSFHPVLAVDANEGTVLGLVDNFFLTRQGGERATRKQRDFADKDSRRWLSGAESASALAEAGAACVTVVEDREGDIYECFAFKPANVEKLVRAAQDRCLADGTLLFAKADAWDEAGRMMVAIARRAGPQSA